MTLEEYEKELANLKIKHRQEEFVLKRKYALENNKVSIGDIIEDHIGKIRVEKILIGNTYNGTPCLVYDGIEQLKKGGDNKKSLSRSVWQSNLK